MWDAGFYPRRHPMADGGARRADDQGDQAEGDGDLERAPAASAASRTAEARRRGRDDHPPGAVFGRRLVTDPDLVQRLAKQPLAVAHLSTPSRSSASRSRPRRNREFTVPRGSSSIRAISPGL